MGGQKQQYSAYLKVSVTDLPTYGLTEVGAKDAIPSEKWQKRENLNILMKVKVISIFRVFSV